ncbi:sensor histidine kinase [Myroides odoratimimus]|uniref:sensor histidine kinase n=1 Tax=Myroides odoratimimus TaxID=76832 RepID=UPI003101071A
MATKKVKEESLFLKHYRLMVVPLVFLLYLFSHFLLNPYDADWFRMDVEEMWESAFVLFLYCMAITEVSLWLSRALNKFLPWDKQPVMRVVVQFFLLLIFIFTVYFAINFVYVYLSPYESFELIDLEAKIDLWQSLIISLNTGIFISAIHTGYFLINNWKKSMVDAAELKLKAEQLERIASQSELESLKMQLDPHFLFNNFSTLSELVIEDQDIAVKFIDHLSLVYRYMLSNVRKNTISLSEELTFVESYFYLIKERMGAKVQLNINVQEEDKKNFYVAPIAIQLLVENAVKHNSASKESPLRIDIYVEEDYVVIRNNIQELVVTLPSSKVGLMNIKERYRLLSKHKVLIQKADKDFVVRLPLLLNKNDK